MSIWGPGYNAKCTCEVTTSDVYIGEHIVAGDKANSWVIIELAAARAPKVSLFDGFSNILLARGFWRVTVCGHNNVPSLCHIAMCNVQSTGETVECNFHTHMSGRREKFWNFTRVIQTDDDVRLKLKAKRRNDEGPDLDLKITMTIERL